MDATNGVACSGDRHGRDDGSSNRSDSAPYEGEASVTESDSSFDEQHDRHPECGQSRAAGDPRCSIGSCMCSAVPRDHR